MKRFLWLAAILLTAPHIIIIAVMFGPWRYDEVRAVEAQLLAIPNVSSVSLHWNEDITVEDISATILLCNGVVVVVEQISCAAISGDRDQVPIQLVRIGPWSFRQTSERMDNVDSRTGKPVRTIAWARSVDLSPSSCVAKFLGHKVGSVKELITHYKETISAIEALYRQSQIHEFVSDSGESYKLEIIRGE